MPKAIGPRKIGKYLLEFKAKAVALSHLPGIEVRQVAEVLMRNEGQLIEMGKSVERSQLGLRPA
jgi:transposase-like protein